MLSTPSWPDEVSLLRHLRSPQRLGADGRLLAVSLHGRHHWWQGLRAGQWHIGLDVIQPPTRRRPQWGYLEVDVTAVDRYDCPSTYLPRQPCDAAPAMAAWMERAAAWHKRQQALESRLWRLSEGGLVRWQGQNYRLTERVGRLGWKAEPEAGGLAIELRPRDLRVALTS